MRLDVTYHTEVDNLIAGVYPPARPDGIVTLAKDQGILARGTLIGLDENGENGKPIGTDFNFKNSVKSAFVLFADTDTDIEEGDSINAQAYTQGNFAVTEIRLGEGYTLSNTDLVELRKFGIIISGDYPSFIEEEDD